MSEIDRQLDALFNLNQSANSAEKLEILDGSRGDELDRAIRWSDFEDAASLIFDYITNSVINTPTVPVVVEKQIKQTESDLTTDLGILITAAQITADGAANDAVQALSDASVVQGLHNTLVAGFVGNLVDRFQIDDDRFVLSEDRLTQIEGGIAGHDIEYNSLAGRVELREVESSNLTKRVEKMAVEGINLTRTISEIQDKALYAILRAGEAETLVRDAGIYVDPASGQVLISAVEAVDGKVTDVSIKIDAVEGEIALKASTAYVNGAISNAILDPSQIPIIDDFELRLSDAEVLISANEASIGLKASILTVDGIDTRLGTAETSVSALNASIVDKVEVTTFNAVETRVTTAENEINAIDGAQIKRSAKDVRFLTEKAKDGSLETLGQLLDYYAERKNLRTEFAMYNEDIRAKVTEDRIATASITTTLGVKIDDNIAAIETENKTRADEFGAVAVTLNTMQVKDADNEALIIEETKARVNDQRVIASKKSLFQVTSDVDKSLKSLNELATNYEDRKAAKVDLAYVAQDLQASITDERVARAKDTTELGVAIDGNKAKITTESKVRADTDKAMASQITTLEADTGANAAQIIAEQIVRASSDSAMAQDITTLRTDVDGTLATLSVNYYTKTENDQAIVTSETLMGARVDANKGEIKDVLDLNLTADKAIMVKFTTMEGNIGIATGNITSIMDLTIDPMSVLATSITTLQGDVGTAQGDITKILNLTVDPGTVLAQDISKLKGDVLGAEGSISDILSLNIDPLSILATRFTDIDGRVGTSEGNIQDVLDLNLAPSTALLTSFTNMNASIGSLEDQVASDFLIYLIKKGDTKNGSAVVRSTGPAAFGQSGTVYVVENTVARNLTPPHGNGAGIEIPEKSATAFSGQRLRIDVLARRSDPLNPSLAYSVAYITSEGAASPITSFSHLGDDVFRWNTFFFDRPEKTVAGSDYLTLFGSDEKNGTGTQFARVIVRSGATVADDIPEIGTLTGSINEVRGLDLNALDGTAFAVFLNQMQVDAGGTSAVITNQSSVLADLNGFSSAFSGLMVESTGAGGTQIAGFKATSWAKPNGSGNATMELLGDVIAQGTLSTNKLVVGLGRNLLTNTNFAAGKDIGWYFGNGPAGVHQGEVSGGLLPAGNPYSGKYYPVYEIFQNGYAQDGYASFKAKSAVVESAQVNGVPIAAGDYIDVSIKASVHYCDIELRARYFDAAGNANGSSVILDGGDKGTGSSDNPSNWPIYWGIAQVPAGTAYATIDVRKLPTKTGTTSYVMLHEPQVAVTHADATERVPFSPSGTTLISGDQIMTNTITAVHANFDSLEALNITVANADIENGAITSAKIGNAEIDAAHIKDGAIDSAKIGDAQIGTLQLAGLSVVIPIFNYVETPFGSGLGTVNTLTIPRAAGVTTKLDVTLKVTGESATAGVIITITRQIGTGAEVIIHSVSTGFTRLGQHLPLVFEDPDLTGGSTQYRVKAAMTGSLEPGNSAPIVSNVALYATQFKR